MNPLRHSVALLAWLCFAAATQAQTIVPISTSSELTSALAGVSEGEILELAGGTYNAPTNGWILSNLSDSFTIRAAAGQTAILDGLGSRTIFRIFVTDPGVSVVFQDLIFEDGFSSQDGLAGGVTLSDAEATFLGCVFRNNVSQAPTTGGGGLAVFSSSVAHIFSTDFTTNLAKNEGAGLKVGGGSRAYVHDSTFTGNRVNIANHRPSAAGGGIHVANSSLDISNSRFEGNVAGCVGGGLYAFGDWTGGAEPANPVRIVNSTFIDNFVSPDSTVTCSFFGAGGGLHAEDEARIEIHNSRFFTNEAEDGGAISMYRSEIEVYDSVFRGNLANGVDARGNGGAIAASSQDSSSDSINRPSSSILIRDSLFQGRFGGTTNAGLRGGCIWTLGDTNRTYGLQGVQQNGTPAINRTVLDVERTVFFDCDVVRQEGFAGSGFGGAVSASHTDFRLVDSLVANSDATGTNAAGGGVRALNESLLTFEGTTFAHNDAELRGGAVDVSGSEVDIDDCQFFGNDLRSGNNGAALSIAASKNVIAGSIDLGSSGLVRNSVFKNHGQVDLLDVDFLCNGEVEPINTVVYNNNEFFTSPPNGDVYRNNQVSGGGATVGELNSLVVNRTLCADTDKATVNNQALTSEPDLAALVAVPTEALPTVAAGDPAPPTDSFLGYAWCGSSAATLDGVPLTDETGLDGSTVGSHTLAVGGVSAVDSIGSGPDPNASFVADPAVISSGQTSDLTWSLTAGTFLSVSLDRGIELASPGASGSETVAPTATTTYDLHLLTEEGGRLRQTTVFVDEPAPGLIFEDGFESGDASAWSTSTGL